MNKFDNIEDLFKEQFAEHTVNPDANNWHQISDNLDGLLVEEMFKTKLSGYAMTPSKKVWIAVAAQIGALGFLGTKIGTFAKYIGLVASVGLLTFAGIWMLSSQETKPNHQTYDSHNYTAYIDQDTCKSLKFETSKVANDNSEAPNQTAFSAKNTQSKNALKTASVEAYKKSEKTINNNITKQNVLKKETQIKKVLSSENLKEQPQLSYIDTIRVVDTLVYYDTISVKVLNKPKNSSSHWSINPYIAFWGTNSKLKGSQYFEDYELNNKDALSLGISRSYGLGVNYDVKNWRFGSGLSYQIIQEKFTYDTEEIFTKTSTKYDLKESGFYNKIVEHMYYDVVTRHTMKVDTVDIHYTIRKIEKPEYTILDTIWTYKTDTTVTYTEDSIQKFDYDTIRVATYDTSFYQTTDTTIKINHYDNINKYSYLEIPIHLSYGFKIEKLTLRPTVGVLIGIMINAKGYGISSENQQTVYRLKNSELPFANISISGMLGLGIEYQLKDNLSIYTQPFYRHNFNSVYQNSRPLQKRFYGLGLSLGMVYHFE